MLEQRASVDFMRAKMGCKCHSESYTEKISAGTRPPYSCGVHSSCMATKATPQALTLLHAATRTALPTKLQGLWLSTLPASVWPQDFLFSSWTELVPGHCFVRTGQEMWPKANEKEPLVAWDGDSTPLSYCFIYLISQKVLRNEGKKYDYDSSRLQLWLLGRGKSNSGEGFASKLRGRL